MTIEMVEKRRVVCLGDLPVEIIIHIGGMLDVVSQAKLSQTNRFFRELMRDSSWVDLNSHRFRHCLQLGEIPEKWLCESVRFIQLYPNDLPSRLPFIPKHQVRPAITNARLEQYPNLQNKFLASLGMLPPNNNNNNNGGVSTDKKAHLIRRSNIGGAQYSSKSDIVTISQSHLDEVLKVLSQCITKKTHITDLLCTARSSYSIELILPWLRFNASVFVSIDLQHSSYLRDDQLEWLAEAVQLEYLSLAGCVFITSETLKYCSNLEKLTVLDISNCNMIDDISILHKLPRLQYIRSWNLRQRSVAPLPPSTTTWRQRLYV